MRRSRLTISAIALSACRRTRPSDGYADAVARLRPDPPADRGQELRLGLDRIRRPGHHHGRRRSGPASIRCVLDMGRQLEVRSGHRAARRRLDSTRPGDSLVVRLARARAASATPCGSPCDYHGRIQQGRGLYFFKEDRAARTGRSRSTAAAGPTAIRAGFPPTAPRTTRRPGSSSPPCPRGSRSFPTAGW